MVYAPVEAAGIFKSIAANGVLEFSDKSPDGLADNTPRDHELVAPDPEVQRAVALVDLAERGVALARRSIWSDRDPARMPTPRMARADVERIEFYKQGARNARFALCQLLQAKRNPGIREGLTASYVAPVGRP
jgi:hypothetical protein